MLVVAVAVISFLAGLVIGFLVNFRGLLAYTGGWALFMLMGVLFLSDPPSGLESLLFMSGTVIFAGGCGLGVTRLTTREGTWTTLKKSRYTPRRDL